ncbi:MAG TPA: type II toxin-antitoxin system VapB family antitoxin [Burkholderiales bacterium]|nr:type II toxin-antitoxin system VapB family antitoxin [Burkholderiales bacterium]
MRTNIDIDDKLMTEAMKAGGFRTKKETVEAALRLFARQKKAYRKLLELGGKVDWDPGYDYKAMRRNPFEDR